MMPLVLPSTAGVASSGLTAGEAGRMVRNLTGSGPYGALILDTFNRADEFPADPANWEPYDSNTAHALAVKSNVARPDPVNSFPPAGNRGGILWRVATDPSAFPVAAFATVSGLMSVSADSMELDLYDDAIAQNGYAFYLFPVSGSFNWHLADSPDYADLSPPVVGRALAAGDKLGLTYDAQTVRVWHLPAGDEWEVVLEAADTVQADTPLRPGIWIRDDGAQATWDDFGGGSTVSFESGTRLGGVAGESDSTLLGPHGTPILDNFNRPDAASPLGSPWRSMASSYYDPGLYIANGLGIGGGYAIADTDLGGEDYGLESMDNPGPALRGEVFTTLPLGNPGDWIYLDLFSGHGPGVGVYELEVRSDGNFNLYDIMDDGSTPQYSVDLVNHPIAVGSAVGLSFDGAYMAAWYRAPGAAWEQIASISSEQASFTIEGLGIATGVNCPVDDFGGGTWTSIVDPELPRHGGVASTANRAGVVTIHSTGGTT